MHKIGGENQVLPRGETYIMSNLVRTIEGINVTEKDYELASKD